MLRRARTLIVATLLVSGCGVGPSTAPSTSTLTGACGRFTESLSREAPAALESDGYFRPALQNGLSIDWSLQTLSRSGRVNAHGANDPTVSMNIAYGPADSPIETGNLVFLLYEDGTFSYNGCVNLSGRQGDSDTLSIHDTNPTEPALVLIDTVFEGRHMYQNTNKLEAVPIAVAGAAPVIFPGSNSTRQAVPPNANPELHQATLSLVQLPISPCARATANCLNVGYFAIGIDERDRNLSHVSILSHGDLNVTGMLHRSVSLPNSTKGMFRLAAIVSGIGDNTYSNQAWDIS